jgi:diguanylate cyclase (GGDEF)-like protein
METTRNRPIYHLGAPDGQETPPCLVVIWGPDLGRKIPLVETSLTIGRDADCDLVVPTPGISRRHCCVEAREGRVRVRDLGSTNGTLLNGRAIVPGTDVELHTGDRVELVGVGFNFLEGGDVVAQYREVIYQLTIVDGLTHAFNRRYLMDFLGREISRCRRHARPLSLLLVDVDHFKRINDGHGHAAGDHVLRELVGQINEGVRREECLARFGGDEFAVVMPETRAEGARIVAERIRGRAEQHAFAWAGAPIGVTLSLGLAELATEMGDAESLMAAADAQLYAAKNGGRNSTAG